MNKKTFSIGTVLVSIIFVVIAVILSSTTHTGLSSAGSFKGYHLGELEKPVLLTLTIDGTPFTIQTVGPDFSIQSIDNDPKSAEGTTLKNHITKTVGPNLSEFTIDNDPKSLEGTTPKNHIIKLNGRIEEKNTKEKNDENKKIEYRIILSGIYVTSINDFQPIAPKKEIAIQEITEDTYKFEFEIGTDLTPGKLQTIATQGKVKATLQLDKL